MDEKKARMERLQKLDPKAAALERQKRLKELADK